MTPPCEQRDIGRVGRNMPLTPSQRQARLRAKRKRYEEALREIVRMWDENPYGHHMVEAVDIARNALTPDKETQG